MKDHKDSFTNHANQHLRFNPSQQNSSNRHDLYHLVWTIHFIDHEIERTFLLIAWRPWSWEKNSFDSIHPSVSLCAFMDSPLLWFVRYVTNNRDHVIYTWGASAFLQVVILSLSYPLFWILSLSWPEIILSFIPTPLLAILSHYPAEFYFILYPRGNIEFYPIIQTKIEFYPFIPKKRWHPIYEQNFSKHSSTRFLMILSNGLGCWE